MDSGTKPIFNSILEAELYRADLATTSLYPGFDVPLPQEELVREK